MKAHLTEFKELNSEEVLVKLFQDISPDFHEEQIDLNKLEKITKTSEEILKKIKINSITLSKNKNLKNEIRCLLDKIINWLQKNFSSVKLNSVIQLISNLLSSIGYQTEIQKEEIIKSLKIETYDQIKTNEKLEKPKDEVILEKDSIITNSFLSVFYSLILTIASKSEIVLKSKNLLRSVLTVLTQICEIDKIAIYFKKKRIISVFSNILKILKSSKESEEYFLQIAKISICFFSKIGMKRAIYRDYIFKKAIPDLLTDLFLQFYKKDSEISEIFSIYTFYAIRIVDHKTYFWSKGIVSAFIEILTNILSDLEKGKKFSNFNQIEQIEFLTLAIYNLAIDNYEVQSELIDHNYLQQAKEILIKLSSQNFIIFNVISTLRRIRDEEYQERITEELLFTFFALFDYFYLKTKKLHEENYEANLNLAITNRFEFMILKELVAILGNIVKDEIHSKPFIDKNLHLVLIDLKLSFSSFPKLIKNTIGALINLANNEEIREELSRAAAFVKSIYIILDKYKENQAIIDYEMKLIINVAKNDFMIKTFISGDLFYYLILFLKNYYDHDEIVTNVTKIIRILILKSKKKILIFI